MRDCVVTADDYGLSRSINSSILETADRGVLSRVSILANGPAFEYAIVELKKRPALELSVHLNLSEGKPLSRSAEVPHLVNHSGKFAYSPLRLFLTLLFTSQRRREELLREIKIEVRAQIERVRSVGDGRVFSIDGHQHVHMIPAVFRMLTALHVQYNFLSVRIPYEASFFVLEDWKSYVSPGLFRHLGLNILARINRREADRRNLAYADHFVGSLMSGHITYTNLKGALQAAITDGAKSVEVGIHPGVAEEGEMNAWSGDAAWYYAQNRDRERELLLEPKTRTLLESFSDGDLAGGLSVMQLVRFFVSGVASLLLTLVLLYVLTEWAQWWYVLSAVVAYGAAIILSFFMQKFWTFKDHGLIGVRGQFLTYVLLNGINLILNAIGLYLIVEYLHVWYFLAEGIVAGAIAAWTYLIMRRLIFKRHD